MQTILGRGVRVTLSCKTSVNWTVLIMQAYEICNDELENIHDVNF